MVRAVACALAILLCGLAAPAAESQPKAAAKPVAKPAAKKKAPPKPTTVELQKLIDEQRTLIEAQAALIAEQQAKIEALQSDASAQDAAIEAQKAQLAEMKAQLDLLNGRLQEVQQQLPDLKDQAALEERLKRIEQDAEKVPELPPNVVSAGDFPGSIRIPNTDAAVKFGGRIRAAGVFTLSALGSDDRFLTNSIPVEPDDAAAGKGRRTTFTANTSRFNFEMRTPTGAGQLRTFIEGDFFGSNANDSRINFRLRHAYAQFHGLIVGQTWSTFSDPAADHQDLDFEGINGENVIRQAQIRYTFNVRNDLNVAVALETPEVSITGGQGVNVAPDVVGRVVWSFREIGHLQGAVVLREIRGEPDLPATGSDSATAWGASLSGVVPFHILNLTDRFIFQLNVGEGNARYINDLNSLGGQDAVFDPVTLELEPLKATGWYLVYEHQWKQWEATRVIKLRSSLIWSFVSVDNLEFQPGDAYRKTSRYSINLVLSPTPRIDCGIEYIWGKRQNFDGLSASADQIQFVGIFRF